MILINKLEDFQEKNPEWNWLLFHGHNSTTGDTNYECRIWKLNYTNQKRIFCRGIDKNMGLAIEQAIKELEERIGTRI